MALSLSVFTYAYSDGDGTLGNPFQISNPADWQILMATPADWDNYFVLTTNINLSGITVTPVGNNSIHFTGNFDGGNYAISNVAISQSDLDCVGLFGRTGSGSQIRNLTVNVIIVAGHGYVGGLVGFSGGTITSCSSAGFVYGYIGVGGLVGRNDNGTISFCSSTANTVSTVINDDVFQVGTGGLVGDNAGPISDSYAAGFVSGHTSIGGLTGLHHYGQITRCHATGYVSGTGNAVGGLTGGNMDAISLSYALGTVSGAGNSVGGLAGYNNVDCTITSCYAAGDVFGSFEEDGLPSGSVFVGGLVGVNSLNSTVALCYATGDVSGFYYIGGLVGYNDQNGTITSCYATGNTTSFRAVGGLAGCNSDGKVIDCYATGIPTRIEFTQITGGLCGETDIGSNYEDTGNFWDMNISGASESAMGTGKTTAQMKTLSTFTAAGWDFNAEWFMPYGGYPRLRWEKVYNGGSGTETDPYQIGSIGDLYNMMGLPQDWDQYFILTSDLDLFGVTFTNSLIAPDTSILINFQGTVFCGVFDGGGHVIRNLRISGGSMGGYVGLFGFVGETAFRGKAGIIRNLGLVNADIEGNGYVGAIAGKVHHGTISNCFSTGTVENPGSYTGGLVGYLGPGTSELWTCSVNDSYSRCQVIGNTTAGGFVGMNYQGQVSHCYSTGQLTGTSNVGGFCGAVNTGGSFADTGNFWDTETSGATVSAMGLGKATRTMKVLTLYSDAGWDFSTIWTICARSNYPRFRWQVPAADWVCPDGVAVEDLRYFAARWLSVNCAASEHCDGTDLNTSGQVNFADFVIFAGLWLEEI
jgi:hypothetical protein